MYIEEGREMQRRICKDRIEYLEIKQKVYSQFIVSRIFKNQVQSLQLAEYLKIKWEIYKTFKDTEYVEKFIEYLKIKQKQKFVDAFYGHGMFNFISQSEI